MQDAPHIRTDNEKYTIIRFGTNILYHAYFDKTEVDIELIKEVINHGFELTNHQPFYSIVNLQDVFGSMSSEAKIFVATNKEVNELKIIEILLVNSLSMKLLVSGYLRFNKPKTKTVVANNFEEIKNILKDENVQETAIDGLGNYLAELKN